MLVVGSMAKTEWGGVTTEGAYDRSALTIDLSADIETLNYDSRRATIRSRM